ncbi:MAG TPA: FlgO family outer membrane protein [Oligoflexia bacterium]|nr:FlgO family outer membrane protein [Oligoflexia bacterium]HMP47429.1 FlgO family outer membrane protein [Oligoflexia bacterium]
MPAFIGIPFPDSENQSVGRFKTSYLSDQIHAYFRGNIAGPIAVTTFVDIDNLYQSSTFGRILAEQLISELSMRGYNVIEIRMSDAVQIMENEGELGLSRHPEVLRPQQALSGLVVGTYAHSNDRVYINTRLIDPRSSNIISVGSVEMTKTREIAQLLRGNSLPTSLERIPVRHLSYQKAPMPYYFGNGAHFAPFNEGSGSGLKGSAGEELAKKLMQEVPRQETKKDKSIETELPPAK